MRSGPGKKPDPEQVIKEYLTAFAEANGRRRGDLGVGRGLHRRSIRAILLVGVESLQRDRVN
mgnify:CR=1 FL=1